LHQWVMVFLNVRRDLLDDVLLLGWR
jgi:hypothetical protein